MTGKVYDCGLLPIGDLFKLITTQSTDIDKLTKKVPQGDKSDRFFIVNNYIIS